MFRVLLVVSVLFSHFVFFAQQIVVGRDTLTVLESGKVLKMPWASGINYSNVSAVDVNADGKKDLIVYDRLNHINTGRFRCFIKEGNAGQLTYRANPDLSYYFPTVTNWAVFYDYNCDGKEDLFCSTISGIKVFRNQSSAANPVQFVLAKNLLYSDYNPNGAPLLGNIYASSVGVPGIADIDNDGDLDILTFSAQGVFIEYHKNMSKETYGTCDSLIFEIAEDCWGNISESSCSISLNQCLPKPFQNKTISINQNRPLHAGSCLTCIDSDNDGDKDLIIGDIFCNKVQFAKNGGNSSSAVITDTTMLYPNFPLKGNTTQIKINNFPCAYYVDVDDDGKKDLVATPSAFGSENFTSMWYYKNTSSTNTVNFQFVKKNLLQDEMIEVGQNSFPMVLDYNNDGKKDVLVGTYGYYLNNNLKSQLTLYQNTGTLAQPVYSLVTRDYAGLSAQNLNHIMPATGDIDNDGDLDIVMGTATGKIHWLENTAGANNPCNFSVFKNDPFGFTTLSSEAVPQLFDINTDGKLDLLIGMKNGRIAYYQNVGTSSVPAFSLITNTFGNVDVRDNVSMFGIDGYAAPYFFTDAGGVKLLVGSITGSIFYYSVPANITQPCNLISATLNNYNEGAQSAICFDDVNNDGKRDLFVGNAGGGLSFFSSKAAFVSLSEMNGGSLESSIDLYPVPANNQLTLRIRDFEFDEARFEITDLMGRVLLNQKLENNEHTLSVAALSQGLYFVCIHIKRQNKVETINKRFLKQD